MNSVIIVVGVMGMLLQLRDFDRAVFEITENSVDSTIPKFHIFMMDGKYSQARKPSSQR